MNDTGDNTPVTAARQAMDVKNMGEWIIRAYLGKLSIRQPIL